MGFTPRISFTDMDAACAAARIESAAEAGRVYVSESVAALLDTDRREPAGSFDLKGIEGSQVLYRLTDAS